MWYGAAFRPQRSIMRLKRHCENVEEYLLACLKIWPVAPSKIDCTTQGGVGNNENGKMSNVRSLARSNCIMLTRGLSDPEPVNRKATGGRRRGWFRNRRANVHYPDSRPRNEGQINHFYLNRRFPFPSQLYQQRRRFRFHPSGMQSRLKRVSCALTTGNVRSLRPTMRPTDRSASFVGTSTTL